MSSHRSIFERLYIKKSPAIHFFFAFFITCFVYRLWLYFSVSSLEGIPVESVRGAILIGWLFDMWLALRVSAAVWLVYAIFSYCRFISGFSRKVLSVFGFALICAVLFVSSILFASAQKVFITLHAPLSLALVVSGYKGFSSTAFLSEITLFKWVFLFFPVASFLFLRRMKDTALTQYLFFILVPVFCINYVFAIHGEMLTMSSFRHHATADNYLFQITKNPLNNISDDFFYRNKNKYTKMKEPVVDEQLHSISLRDPNFISATKIDPVIKPNKVKKQWNVVLVILESTSMEYVFDFERFNKMPMPFLKSLSEKGVLFENNFSAGNSSVQGIFSILSGKYPFFGKQFFEISGTNVVPAMTKFLDKDYSVFMAHPSTEGHYMPAAFVRHSGIPLYEKESMTANHSPDLSDGWFVNERDGIDFFINKINQSKAPFFGIYFSGAPHYPYYDYGKDFRITNNIDPEINRYYNNLYLMDTQLKRIMKSLASSDHLHDTILVVVGDHGEGFGQHPTNWKHSTSLHKQQVYVPALIYQPSLLKPQKINMLTSIVDLMPTLLDLMSVPYDETAVQGISLAREQLQRHYIFMAGTLGKRFASINQNQQKLILNLDLGHCDIYDLAIDPAELNPLSCDTHEAQLKDLVRFYQYQNTMLMSYNKRYLEERRYTA